MDLVASIKLAGTAVKFVEGGPLAEALAELNMSAAISAMNKAKDAKDRRAQVWSAVNHLEGAQAALESKVRGTRGKAQVMLRTSNWFLLHQKRAYVLALMAVCYRYLGEERLAEQAIESGKEEYPYGMGWTTTAVGALTALVNPVDSSRYEVGKVKYRIDWEQFRLPPRGRPSAGGPQLR